jgi:hypothetical protein
VSAKKREPRVVTTPAPPRRQVLEEIRDAAERPIGQAVGDCLPGEVVEGKHDGVDRRVARLDARDRGVEELGRRDLPAADQVREPDGVVRFVLRESGHSYPPWSRANGCTIDLARETGSS